MTGLSPAAGTANRPAGHVAHAVLRLVRWENCVAVGLTTLVGAHLAGDVATPRAALAVGAVVTLHAAGTAFNDRCDVTVDRIARPERPLPSGRLSVASADRLAAGMVLLGLGLAATLGPGALAVAAVVAIASAAYALRLKNSVLVGNLTVAMLSAATVPFGAVAVGRGDGLPGPAVRGGLLILAYMVAYEVLKCLQDVESDAAAGIGTIATSWGPRAALATATTALVAFGVVAAWPLVVGDGQGMYGIAVVLPLTCVAGSVLSAHLVRNPLEAWDRAVGWLKAGWFLSLPALALLT
jgi:geranylgeranylglycerol-phosphate geranylgeranyltransferase